MLQISECTRDIPCIDCDNTKCAFQGKKESNCPKYRCDRPDHDCEQCDFIDRFIADMRKGADRAYQRGLEDAWEVAKKIVAIYKRHELQNMGFKCDGSDYNFSIIVEDYTAQEAIAKIKEYEAKKKQDSEIKVGDEVFCTDENDPRVVVRITQMSAVQFSKDGKCAVNNVKELHKTGRTFPQIAEVLAEMRGDSE